MDILLIIKSAEFANGLFKINNLTKNKPFKFGRDKALICEETWFKIYPETLRESTSKAGGPICRFEFSIKEAYRFEKHTEIETNKEPVSTYKQVNKIEPDYDTFVISTDFMNETEPGKFESEYINALLPENAEWQTLMDLINKIK